MMISQVPSSREARPCSSLCKRNCDRSWVNVKRAFRFTSDTERHTSSRCGNAAADQRPTIEFKPRWRCGNQLFPTTKCRPRRETSTVQTTKVRIKEKESVFCQKATTEVSSLFSHEQPTLLPIRSFSGQPRNSQRWRSFRSLSFSPSSSACRCSWPAMSTPGDDVAEGSGW